MSIDYKELFAIVAAVLTWGSGWQGKGVIFITDNKPITEIWHSGTTSSIHLMSLVRKLFLIAARPEFSVSFKHIYGVNNPVADALSRFQMSKFHHLVPDADQHNQQHVNNYNHDPSINELTNTMQHIMTSTLAPSTQRNYDSSFRNYIAFCRTKNLCALPIHEFNLMLYTTKLSQTTSYSNIKVHISSIKHFAVLYQYHQNVPPLPRLYMLIRAVKRQHGKNFNNHNVYRSLHH